MNMREIIEKIETIMSATDKNGEINRKKAERIIDPHGFFHHFKINEDEIIDPEEAYDDDFIKLMKIKKRLESMTKFALNKCHIAYEDMYYDEDENTMSITLEENEIDTDVLNKLQQSGLSKKYIIAGSQNYNLKLIFEFNKDLL